MGDTKRTIRNSERHLEFKGGIPSSTVKVDRWVCSAYCVEGSGSVLCDLHRHRSAVAVDSDVMISLVDVNPQDPHRDFIVVAAFLVVWLFDDRNRKSSDAHRFQRFLHKPREDGRAAGG